MRQLKLRVVYNPRLEGDRAIPAVINGVRRFERYGVMYESDKATLEAVKGVLAGRQILTAVNSLVPPVITQETLSPNFAERFTADRSIRLIGVTPLQIFTGCTPRSGTIGVALRGEAAMLSTKKIGTVEEGIREAVMTLASIHEIGHLLGASPLHCANSDCIMQENRNIDDFIERFVRPRLDFCRICERVISDFVNNFALYG